MSTDIITPARCAASECDRPGEVRGLCRKHYQRIRRHGALVNPDALDRAIAKLRFDDSGCWVWTGYRNENGYGQIGADSVVVLAHRWFYEQLVEPIPEGLTLDHLCRVKACVNPEHLEPVTLAENIRRSAPFREYVDTRVVCANGHPLSGSNAYPRSGRRSSLGCRACDREKSRRYRKNRSAA